jgi:general secretion pathway protein H
MNSRRDAERGFTLIEMVAVMAIVGLLAAVVVPAVPRQTSPSRLQAFAIDAASLLKVDRNAAIRERTEISTLVDAPSRLLRSGATGAVVRVPDDVRFDALLPENCNRRPVISSISFFASGMSCGGVVAFSNADKSYEIQVNWLTGRIEVVARGQI